MSILHRVFISKHKRKKIFIRRKRVYKKFIGLKTFKTRIYTGPSLTQGELKPKRNIPKAVPIKNRLPRKSQVQLKFPNFKVISPRLRREEAIAAQVDIATFKTAKIESLNPKPPEHENKFQAYIPHELWAKMTSEQRRIHITKRKERAIMARTKPRSKYVLSNRKSRAVLRHMSALHRRSYLKNLIKFAEMNASAYQIVPFDKQKFAELALNKVKRTLRARKNTRKTGSVYKNLTYTSLIPKAARLTVEARTC